MPAPLSVTPEVWAHVVEVFTKHGGLVSAAANELGWGIKRAHRVLHQGYPSIGYPPVATLIGKPDPKLARAARAARVEIEAEVAKEAAAELQRVNEQIAARSAELERIEVLSHEEQKRMVALVERENEREKAREDAIRSRGEEASLVSAGRRNALALNAVTAQVLRGAVRLAGRIQTALEDEASNPTLTLAAQLQLVRSAAQIARFNAEAGLQAVKAERLVLGAPPAEENHEVGGSLEEAAKWVETSLRALQRAKDRGLILTAEVVTPGIHGDAPAEVVTPGIHGAEPELEDEDDLSELVGSEEDDEVESETDPSSAPDPDLVREATRSRLPSATEERVLARARLRSRGRLRAVLPPVRGHE